MDEKKLTELLNDSDFVVQIMEAATFEEVRSIFSERGVEVTDEDINLMARAAAEAADKSGGISDENLKNISGGNTKDMAMGGAIGASVVLIAGAISSAYAFKKGIDYSDSWWNKTISAVNKKTYIGPYTL